ncbi:acetyl-CoA C-acetyltransferase [Desemzia sp. FAM 24101]|uniref:acetyl-CoA C-acetyltransferase n=1 Tax=unclassified Desemzia TaxID=2685243 RepID=UPI0038870E94
MEEVVIVSAVRTPIGSLGGQFKDTSAVQLGTVAATEVLHRSHLQPEDVDSVIFGNVLQAGLGQNPARQISIHSGIPNTIPAMTVNEMCGSGLKAVILASQAIQVGDAKVVLAGGTENMSQAPYLLKNQRFGSKLGDTNSVDSLVHDGLTDAFNQQHMGITAENVAERYHVSRKEQDQFALDSQIKTATAQENDWFKDEIVPVSVQIKRETQLISDDEYPRKETTIEKLQKLRPAFKKEGTVTAGNASGINDGAAAILLMAKTEAEKRNIPYLATIKGYSEVGTDPEIMGYAPYTAVQKVFEKTNFTKEDIDLYEFNEAFASQSIALVRDLELPTEKVNIHGGAIALGHPIGASGSRILVTLLNAMKQNNKKRGLATLCVGGGIGIAMIIESAEQGV